MMKKYTLFLVMAFLSMAGYSQINLIGAKAGGGIIQIAEWQALDPSSLVLYPTNLQSYLMASSVYDAWNGNYYLTGEAPSGFGLLSFNSVTNQQSVNTFSAFSNITEIDMSTAKIYTLTMNGPDTIRVNEYDIATGTTILLGVVAEPGLQGIVVEATGFDSNHGILYYVGFNGNGQRWLYGMNVREPVFTYSRIPVIAPSFAANLTCLQYDNLNNRLFGLMSVYDSSWTFSSNHIAEIDYQSGMVTELGELSGFTGYLAGSSSFDQLTGSFLLAGVDTSFALKMIVFNTADSTFVTGYVPSGVSEIVCDNYSYARSAYTSVDERISKADRLRVFPVPAQDHLTVELDSGPAEIQITDSRGRIVYSREETVLRPVINLAAMPAGLYIIVSRTADKLMRARFIKTK